MTDNWQPLGVVVSKIVEKIEKKRNTPDNMPGRGWTDERVEELKKLREQGLSASKMAAALGGVTRNAVIGKLARMGMSVGKNAGIALLRCAMKTRKPRERKEGLQFDRIKPQRRRQCLSAREEREAMVQTRRDTPELIETSEDAVEFMQLESHHCRWMLGGSKQFCGKQKYRELPYCSHHAVMAYRRP